MKSNLVLFFALGTAVLASCNEEDFGYESKAIQYETNFKQTFGDVPQNQNWDFYAQAMNAVKGGTTRAITDKNVTISDRKTYTPDETMSAIIASAKAALPNGDNNSAKGHQAGELVSTGDFSVYTVLYGGADEKNLFRSFSFGIEYKGEKQELFGKSLLLDNPHSYYDITIPVGESYRFYVDYSRTCWGCLGTGKVLEGLSIKDHDKCNGTGSLTRIFYSDSQNCRSVYDNISTDETTRTLVLGFEDIDLQDDACDKDFNDFIVMLKGNLPLLEAKRYMCEDLGNSAKEDFLDFNDIVFDVQPSYTQGTDVVLRAVGGTLPIELYVNDAKLSDANGNSELHAIFGVDTKVPVNVGATTGETKDAITINLPGLTISDLSTFNAIKAVVTYEDGTKQDLQFGAADGNAAKIFAVPVSTAWMKENNCIKAGYSGYFQTEGWYNNPTDASKLYKE